MNTILNESSSKDKRSKIENLIYSVMDKLDPTKRNSKKYKELFDSMDDNKFNSWMKNFLSDESENFYLEVEPFVNEPKMNDIQKAADTLKVPLMERVVMPFLDPNGEPIVSKKPVIVGYCHMKRVNFVHLPIVILVENFINCWKLLKPYKLQRDLQKCA